MKIICITENYICGVQERVGTMEQEPVFFMKPDTALLRNNDPFYVPTFCRDVRCGAELVVRIGRVGKCVAERFAHRYYTEVGLGVGFTACDRLRDVRAAGLPWENSVAFDHSAALSPVFVPLDELGGDVAKIGFSMSLNGNVQQEGETARMRYTVDRIISYVSQYVTLRIGDLIYTGMPAPAVPVQPGDRLEASLQGRKLLDFEIR